jgi:hypothetical protein
MVSSASPWKSCTRGRGPVYPGYMASTMAPHSSGVCTTAPPAQGALQPPSGLLTAQQPAGTPAKAEPALKTSGYSASSASVIIPPEESPITYTRSGFAPCSLSAYATIWAMACVCAAAVTGEGLGRPHVPAAPAAVGVRSLRDDHDEPILVRGRHDAAALRLPEDGGGRAAAEVHEHQEGRVLRQVVRTYWYMLTVEGTPLAPQSLTGWREAAGEGVARNSPGNRAQIERANGDRGFMREPLRVCRSRRGLSRGGFSPPPASPPLAAKAPVVLDQGTFGHASQQRPWSGPAYAGAAAEARLQPSHRWPRGAAGAPKRQRSLAEAPWPAATATDTASGSASARGAARRAHARGEPPRLTGG